MKIQHFTTLVLGTICISSAQAAVVYDDAVDGFASSDGSAPTVLSFALGTNSVLGTVSTNGGDPAIGNTRNFYTFNILAGQTLDAINLSAISVTTSTGAASNDPGFLALVSGTTAATPGGGFPNLGGVLYNPSNLDDNFLPLISGGGISAGSGFTEIGPGDYTFVIQQTGDEISNFQLDFVVNAVPEPSAASSLLLGSLLLLRRRNRR